jgi:hypothetical protein
MRSAVLARPNLKFFAVGAVLMVLIQHIFTNGLSLAQTSSGLMAACNRVVSDAELEGLLRQARELPSAGVYVRISRAYENRGDFKHALRYLRRAEKMSEPGMDLD